MNISRILETLLKKLETRGKLSWSDVTDLLDKGYTRDMLKELCRELGMMHVEYGDSFCYHNKIIERYSSEAEKILANTKAITVDRLASLLGIPNLIARSILDKIAVKSPTKQNLYYVKGLLDDAGERLKEDINTIINLKKFAESMGITLSNVLYLLEKLGLKKNLRRDVITSTIRAIIRRDDDRSYRPIQISEYIDSLKKLIDLAGGFAYYDETLNNLGVACLLV